MTNLGGSIAHLHNIPPFLASAKVAIWQVAGFPTDFRSNLDGLVIDYIVDHWEGNEPQIKGTASAGPNQREVTIGNFEYDKFRTYYIKVTEKPAKITNRKRDNLTGFDTPIEFEINVRRLAKGETFREMQGILNELTRIFVMYQRLDIYGIEGISFESLTPLQNRQHRTRHPAIKTIWKKTLRICLYYNKVSLLRSTS